MELVLRFINAGGGVLLFPSETNRCTQQFPTLAQKLGAILPLETVVETDPAKRGCLPRMCKAGGAVAHTTRVASNHPVTAGVRGLLYPTTQAYNGAMGGNIIVDSNWTTLVTGSRSSLSVPTNMSHCECRSPPLRPRHEIFTRSLRRHGRAQPVAAAPLPAAAQHLHADAVRGAPARRRARGAAQPVEAVQHRLGIALALRQHRDGGRTARHALRHGQDGTAS